MANKDNLLSALQDVRKMRRSVKLREETDPVVVAETLKRILHETIAIKAANEGALGRGAINELHNIRKSIIAGQIDAGAAGGEYVGKISLVLDEIDNIDRGIQTDSTTDSSINPKSMISSLARNVPSASTLVSAMITANPILGYSAKIVGDLFSSRREQKMAQEEERRRRYEILQRQLEETEQSINLNKELEETSTDPEVRELAHERQELLGEKLEQIRDEIHSLNTKIRSEVSLQPLESDTAVAFDSRVVSVESNSNNERTSSLERIDSSASKNLVVDSTKAPDSININTDLTKTAYSEDRLSDIEVIESMRENLQSEYEFVKNESSSEQKHKLELIKEQLDIVEDWAREFSATESKVERATIDFNESQSNLIRLSNDTLEENKASIEESNRHLERIVDIAEDSSRLERDRLSQDEANERERSFKGIDETKQAVDTKSTKGIPAIIPIGRLARMGGIMGLVAGLTAAILVPFKGLLTFFVSGAKLLGTLGKFTLIFAAVKAVFDFVDGFFKAADILGRDVDIGDRIKVGFANVVSGLLAPIDWVLDFFGMGFMGERADMTRKVFDGINQVIDFLTMPLEWLQGLVTDGIEAVMGFSPTEFVNKIERTISDTFDKVLDTLFGVFESISDKINDIRNGINNWTEDKIRWVEKKLSWIPGIGNRLGRDSDEHNDESPSIRVLTSEQLKEIEMMYERNSIDGIMQGFESRIAESPNLVETTRSEIIDTPSRSDLVTTALRENDTIETTNNNNINQNNVVAPSIVNNSSSTTSITSSSSPSNEDRTWRRNMERLNYSY